MDAVREKTRASGAVSTPTLPIRRTAAGKRVDTTALAARPLGPAAEARPPAPRPPATLAPTAFAAVPLRSRAPLAGSGSAAHLALLDLDPEPLPRRLLRALLASRARAFAVVAALFVVVGIAVTSVSVDRFQPAETVPSAAVLDLPQPGLVASQPGGTMANGVASAPPSRSGQSAVRSQLGAIGEGLQRYAARYGRFPDDLAPNLSELADFGDFAPALAGFADGRLASYRRLLSRDLSRETAVLEAAPAAGGERVRLEVVRQRFP